MGTKKVAEIIRSQQQTNSGLQLKSEWGSQKLRKTDKGYELSLYCDEMPDVNDFTIATNRLSIAFPKMSKEFFVLLIEFMMKENFTAKRLEDAVNHVISTFQYKELNISDIIKFDRRVKLYTGHEFMNAQMNGTHPSEFEKREIDGTLYWVKKSDLINHF